jgi:hypothetical protein
MLEWIKGWTFFNWLAVIAFLFSSISVLNAIFNLRSRYKDWRATKSKAAFVHRLKELEHLVNQIGEYRKDQSQFILTVLHNGWTIRLRVLFAIAMFAIGWFLSVPPVEEKLLIYIVLSSGMMLLLSSILASMKFSSIIRYVRYPAEFKQYVTDFIKSGVSKGLLSFEDGKAIIEALFNNNLITVGQYEDLEKLLGKPPTC